MGGHGHSWFLFKSHPKAKIEDGFLSFPNPCPITQGGQDVPYFICPEDLTYETLWKEDINQRRKNCKLQNIQGRERGGECIWDYDIQIQGPVDNHGAAPRNCERNSIDLCSTLVSMVVNNQKRWLVMVSWLVVMLMVVMTETLPESKRQRDYFRLL